MPSFQIELKTGVLRLVMDLKGTLMEHDWPIIDFEIHGGKLVSKKEHLENSRVYPDYWTPGDITEQDLQSFLCYRTPVWHRPSVKRMCKSIGVLPGDIDGYIKRVHGVWGDDHFWVRFPKEDTLCWDDVKIRD